MISGKVNIKLKMLSILLMLCCIICIGYGQEERQTEVLLSDWLKTEPVSIPVPVFSGEKNIHGKCIEMSDLLEFEQIELSKLQPSTGKLINWNSATQLTWKTSIVDSLNRISLGKNTGNDPQICFLSTYIYCDRWNKIDIEITSHHLFQLWFDGHMLESKTSSEDGVDEGVSICKELKLETGKHLILIKALYDPDNTRDWEICGKIKVNNENKESLVLSLLPEQFMTVKNLLYTPAVSSISISPDGELVAISMLHAGEEDKKTERWLEIRKFSDGSLRQTYRGGINISSVKWAPQGHVFSYIVNEEDATTLRIVNPDKGTNYSLLNKLENFDSYSWSPDGSFIIYSISEKHRENETGVRRLKGMEDRQQRFRSDSYLYLVNIPQGTKYRLTAGRLSNSLQSISPDGGKLIFSRNFPDYSERPYSKSRFYILNLGDMSMDTLWTCKWASSVQWSPDGTKILITGGPSMFNNIGRNVPEGVTPNDYDGQAFIYDINTKKVEAITSDFNPAISQAIWSKTEDAIYFRVADRSYSLLYRYDIENKFFKEINLGIETLRRIDIAENEPAAVFYGSSAAVPYKIYALNLKSKSLFDFRKSKENYRLLFDPAESEYKNVVLSDVKRWTFENNDGIEIEGRIYFPPDFDKLQQYPCIVYYYGGTSPVSRDFDGRYPKNYWAANGYIVYVLQPSGATGFGQEFSAKHVNEWGTIVLDEIILGTTKFLKAHSFIDPERVGCIGASYGGYTTEILITRTDLFSAAVSHAGISSIASYWGEGFWGYEYGAVANADRFPWSHSDYFVNQSALFNADKINTPLLMTHGTIDNNVPPGESIQLYTALKLLDKDVEFLEVVDQGHWVLDYSKREVWSKSIVAWFDKWLKEQPQWWNDMYGE